MVKVHSTTVQGRTEKLPSNSLDKYPECGLHMELEYVAVLYGSARLVAGLLNIGALTLASQLLTSPIS